MPVYKRKYKSGSVVWSYVFSGPSSTRARQNQITASGFTTKTEAVNAEAARRLKEQEKYERAQKFAAPGPTTLGKLLDEFMREHAEKRLAPKTVERYREQAGYLAPELLAMPLPAITALHLSREWNRLAESGGHSRYSKAPRPLSAKTVRNISGLVSSAFSRAILWGLLGANPATHSDPPKVRKHAGMALTAEQQEMLFAAARGPWCLEAFFVTCAGTGARRGEVLALRWSDIIDGRACIARSLCQTRDGGLVFKAPKNERPRIVKLPGTVCMALERHYERQAEFRRQFGHEYRADLNLIFAHPDGTPLRPDSISATVSALFRRLRLPKGASLHSLRHTHASHLLADGMALPAVSARLGHSSPRVTAEIYSHAIHGQDDEAAAKWDNYQKRALGARSAVD